MTKRSTDVKTAALATLAAMGEGGGAGKPSIEADVACPECGAALHVKVWKKRMNPVTAEYDIRAVAEADKQTALFSDAEPGTAE